MLNKEDIMRIIPHRPPFLLIDEVLEIKPPYVLARKYVDATEYYFQGHFPGNPVMPGVLIVEAMAQAGAVMVLSMEEYKGKTAYFAGIKNAKFKRKVLPGDFLTIEVEVNKIRHQVGYGTAKATVDGELACSTDISFFIDK